MSVYDFKVILEPDPDGGYVISCPSLPGCYSQGDSVDEALANIREAIELVVEDLKARGEEIPDPHPVSPRLPVISGREAVRAFGQGRHRASRRG